MGKIDNFRKLMALPEVMKNVELTNKLKDAYTDYLELLDQKNELQEKLNKINDISDIKKNAKIYSGFYTLDGVKDIHGEEICFCLNCLYEHNLQIPMMFGIVQDGLQDMLSGQVFRNSVYGLSCHKCGTKLAVNNKGGK